MLERVPQVQAMSLAEKAQLVDELWQDLEAHFNAMPISPEMLAEMDQELNELRRDPSRGSTWEQVRERLRPSNPRVQERVEALAEKCNEGLLTPAERAEYEALIWADHSLGLLLGRRTI